MSKKVKRLTRSSFINTSDTAKLLDSAQSVYKKIMQVNKTKLQKQYFNNYARPLEKLIRRLMTDPPITSSAKYESEGVVENANRAYHAFSEARNSILSFSPKKSSKLLLTRPEKTPSLLETRKCLRRLAVVENQFLHRLDLSENLKTWYELVQSTRDLSKPVACSGKQLQDAENLIRKIRMKLDRIVIAAPEIAIPTPHRTERREHSRGKPITKHDDQIGIGYGEVEGGSVEHYSRDAQDKNLLEQLEEAAERFHNTGSRSRR